MTLLAAPALVALWTVGCQSSGPGSGAHHGADTGAQRSADPGAQRSTDTAARHSADAAARHSADAAARPVPLLEGLGSHTRKVSTSDPLAQRYFDQGLTLAYAFNHDEAIRSFAEAARLDPQCAMAWWGIALCNGPHINFPMVPPERARAAWNALQRALEVQDHATPVERALIAALSTRYADPQPEDRRPLDEAYAQAMGEVAREYPDDPDVGTLYAEALMDLQPWDLWADDGQPKGVTPDVIDTLERVLRIQPDHPGALHLYIHTIEASPEPQRALAAADRLCDLVPGAGHLVHMPSHIYVLTGHWDKAAAQNVKAMEADRAYRAVSPRQGFFRLYMMHNNHMLAFAAMMQGRYQTAVKAARDMVASIPEDYLRENAALADPYMMIVPQVLMRFGKWREVLAEPEPPAYLPITTALWHFTRGVAFANTEQFDQAAAERRAFEQACARVPDDALMAINPAHDILRIARHMLDGEIAYRQGELDTAVTELRKAVAIEDRLRYMEPPEWIQPVRHTLGVVLMDAGRFKEAEQVYRENLKKWPDNGWSLYGLARCLERRGDKNATAIEAQFKRAWAHADTPIHASCLCAKK